MSSALSLAVPIVFLLLALFFGIFTFVLEHHWRKYGVSAARLAPLRRAYYPVSFLLLFFMAVFGFIYFLFS